MRNPRDIRLAFILKQCWLIASSSSIWSDFMHRKYKIGVSPVFWSSPSRGSLVWKDILSMKRVFAKLCSWDIGRGDLSSWFNNWVPKFSFDFLALTGDESNAKLGDFCMDGIWNFDCLHPHLDQHWRQFAQQHAHALSLTHDVIHRNKTPSGCFSTRSAWEEVRHQKR